MEKRPRISENVVSFNQTLGYLRKSPPAALLNETTENDVTEQSGCILLDVLNRM
jgi:hypothetical protein